MLNSVIFKKLITATLAFIFSLFTYSVVAAEDSAIVYFNEKEQGIDPYPVRYIFSEDLLRIDDNIDEGDFVLYDDRKRVIYSVNHDDETILVIKYSKWSLPEFKYKRNETWKKLQEAPKIANKDMHTYWLSAGDKVCAEAQIADGFLSSQSTILQRYRETLSADQINSIAATPEDMRTPCMMVDLVYNTGTMYSRGLAIQEWHSNGLQRLMTGFEVDKKLPGSLFELPAEYKRYSMGDNLEFGGPGLEGTGASGSKL